MNITVYGVEEKATATNHQKNDEQCGCVDALEKCSLFSSLFSTTTAPPPVMWYTWVEAAMA